MVEQKDTRKFHFSGERSIMELFRIVYAEEIAKVIEDHKKTDVEPIKVLVFSGSGKLIPLTVNHVASMMLGGDRDQSEISPEYTELRDMLAGLPVGAFAFRKGDKILGAVYPGNRPTRPLIDTLNPDPEDDPVSPGMLNTIPNMLEAVPKIFHAEIATAAKLKQPGWPNADYGGDSLTIQGRHLLTVVNVSKNDRAAVRIIYSDLLTKKNVSILFD